MSEGVCGSNQQLMEVKRELEHAQSKIATLEKRLFRAEEAADVADLERNEAQKARDQLLKRVASMDRRLSGNFNTLQKVAGRSHLFIYSCGAVRVTPYHRLYF